MIFIYNLNFFSLTFTFMNRVEQLKEFLKETPDDPFLNYALTMEYQKIGEFDKTRKGFDHMISTFPNYVGTYYHFGKFLETQGEKEMAAEIYNKGILVARSARNMHAANELQGALNLLMGLEDDDD